MELHLNACFLRMTSEKKVVRQRRSNVRNGLLQRTISKIRKLFPPNRPRRVRYALNAHTHFERLKTNFGKTRTYPVHYAYCLLFSTDLENL